MQINDKSKRYFTSCVLLLRQDKLKGHTYSADSSVTRVSFMPGCNRIKIAFLRADMIPRILLFVLFYFAFISTSQAIDKKPIVLRYNLSGTEFWIPFGYSRDDKNPGIFAELIDVILNKANFSYKFFYYPPKRAIQEFEKDQLDIDFMSLSWFKNGDLGDDYVQTIGIFELTEYNVTLPKNAKKYSTPHSIYGNQVGTIRGYSYFNDDMFTRVDFSSENVLIKGLSKGRFEVAILEGLTAQHWANHYNLEITLASIHSRGDIVLRVRREFDHLIPELNTAIRKIKKEGEIEKIFQRYNVLLNNMKI
ncbi:ABC transporter substrate-binding protein [Aliiglaciecola sp. 3_MG-2023]|uniref:substrate-binding periplasmic protein n=1 Tax=Aliiglaciecola sp. 3_MG-2023 TaxID=3062644 RepID=UPI0026E3E81E|nr:transporter substrate-binding domain-containing protein [Aliiglaciecola sp. 3_MG-2023]